VVEETLLLEKLTFTHLVNKFILLMKFHCHDQISPLMSCVLSNLKPANSLFKIHINSNFSSMTSSQ